jgi:hypothetical protein
MLASLILHPALLDSGRTGMWRPTADAMKACKTAGWDASPDSQDTAAAGWNEAHRGGRVQEQPRNIHAGAHETTRVLPQVQDVAAGALSLQPACKIDVSWRLR